MRGTMSRIEYGVIAYEPTPGVAPRDDPAHFDGWYTRKEDAGAVFELFIKLYPKSLVHLVTRVTSEWRGGSDD
jgi:hypothetical protein